MDLLKLTSCMAANSEFVCRQIADYVATRLKLSIQFVDDIPWQARERLIDSGEIQVYWICGLVYVLQADQQLPIELLAAPVMQGDRYQHRPIYFSDVIVRQDSQFQSFSELQGASWAYNEPRSHSGYYVTRYSLATRGLGSGYFGQVVASGAHQTSLQLVLRGEIDASAIDSTVLALELQRDPTIADQIRIIDSFGPSPIPPWIISTDVPLNVRQDLRQAFLQMHTDAAGKAILSQGLIDRFVPVSDSDYDPLRVMIKQAETVVL